MRRVAPLAILALTFGLLPGLMNAARAEDSKPLETDEGEGWISLYGNNESLRVRVGDWVSPGQVIAEAGHAAVGFPGAWFALRHDGRPVDPRAWLQAAP